MSIKRSPGRLAPAWPMLVLAMLGPAGHGLARGGTDPSMAAVATGTSAPSPRNLGLDGAWQVGSGSGAITFTITGTVMSGRTACGPFTASIGSAPNNMRAVVLSMPSNCPRRQSREQTVFRMQLQAATQFAVVGGRLEARDQAGALLFAAAPIDPASVRSGAGSVFDGAWSAVQPRGRLAGAIPAARLRIMGNQLTVTGACNEYSGTLTTGLALWDSFEARVLISSATQRQCALLGAEEADAQLLRDLESIRWVRMIEGQLELRASQAPTVLRFARL